MIGSAKKGGSVPTSNFTSTVVDISVLRQAVLNTTSSIELLREAVSNSVDADARSIDIKLASEGGEVWTVVIQDDGHGMEERHMQAFFNTGQTEKDDPSGKGVILSIGEKGLGSKTSFVAKNIEIESRRRGSTDLLVGVMPDPLGAIEKRQMPTYTIKKNPGTHTAQLVSAGTRITLTGVHLAKFNGKASDDASEIARRIMHYLRTMCATGTVKNRHAAKTHVGQSVFNVGSIPQVTVEVTSQTGNVTLGPESGAYPVPAVNVTPSGGQATEGIPENSKLFCDTLDFERSKTLAVQGQQITVYYDGTAIIAGESVRTEMLRDELRAGLTHKSQMGLHLSKDFIPLHRDDTLSRALLDNEYYYDFKVFVNCQTFQLNSDRNSVTNWDSSEISWIQDDFKKNVWPSIEQKAKSYRQMRDDEQAAIESIRKTQNAAKLKTDYASSPGIVFPAGRPAVKFVKSPKKEADVSHLLAMMVEAGHWASELAPIAKFGQYIDDSTDVIVEDANGTPQLVEIETSLPNLFRHQHPMSSYDLVAVWSLGGMTNGTQQKAPWGQNGSSVTVVLLQDSTTKQWSLKWGTHTRRVIVLTEIL
jgi:Histidine kinase-, DNA gyrase B-, and HSP90-like ATPase